jgi:hypothetical protein
LKKGRKKVVKKIVPRLCDLLNQSKQQHRKMCYEYYMRFSSVEKSDLLKRQKKILETRIREIEEELRELEQVATAMV